MDLDKGIKHHEIKFMMHIILGMLFCMFFILIIVTMMFYNRHLIEAQTLEFIIDLNDRVAELEQKEKEP